MKTYRVNEIFYSVQGEGLRFGIPHVFVRFSGCNLKCSVDDVGFDCDTEFTSGRDMTADEIHNEAMNCLEPFIAEGKGKFPCNVLWTGGEPALQLDGALVQRFKGWHQSIETNGTRRLPHGLDWLTFSPKTAEHTLVQPTLESGKKRMISELKYVRGYGQSIPKPSLHAANHLLSPAFDGLRIDPRAMAWCVDLCRANPTWRLSVQQHKLWGVR